MTATAGAQSVLIVDDEDDLRALLRVVLADGSGRFEVVGEAIDGDDAIEQWRSRDPDIVLLDQRMPGLSGLEVAEIMLAEKPDQAIVLFSAYLTALMTDRATELGVGACVAKEDVLGVPEVIRRVFGV